MDEEIKALKENENYTSKVIKPQNDSQDKQTNLQTFSEFTDTLVMN